MRRLLSGSRPSPRHSCPSSEPRRQLRSGARAPIEEIEAMRRRMGWKFPFVSSYHSEFNYDFNVSFTREDVASGRTLYNFSRAPEWAAEIEDLSGNSVFYKDEAGRNISPYSTFGRGGEEFLGIYRILDVMPKGRDENGPYRSLADWARPRNMCQPRPGDPGTQQAGLPRTSLRWYSPSISSRLKFLWNPGWCCCENSRLRTFPRRCADVLGWIIPGVIMAMLRSARCVWRHT